LREFLSQKRPESEKSGERLAYVREEDVAKDWGERVVLGGEKIGGETTKTSPALPEGNRKFAAPFETGQRRGIASLRQRKGIKDSLPNQEEKKGR